MSRCLRSMWLFAFLCAACGGDDDGPSGDDPGADECSCVALGADVTAGVGSAIALGIPSLQVTADVAAGGISGDPVVRVLGDKVYVVNRFGYGNVTVIDPSTWQVEQQFSIGKNAQDQNANAYDVAIAGGEAWVVAFDLPVVRVFDLASPMTAPVEIALPRVVADDDAAPEAASIVITGGKAYVALEHLKEFVPVAKGQIVVIDVAGKTVEGTSDLTTENPTTQLREAGGALYVGTTPSFGDATKGCLEKVTTGATAQASCLVTAAALGGTAGNFVVQGDGAILAISVQDAFNYASKLVEVSAAGQVSSITYVPEAVKPLDVATCGKYVVLTDYLNGVRVYDREAGQELAGSPIAIGQDPVFGNGLACF